jgi:tetratricopeptide (TPR) repeat protein
MNKKEQKEMDFEIQFYEGIIDKRRDFIEALVALGDLYTRRGYFEKGLDVDKRLAQLRTDDPYIFYNLACSHSLLNNIEEALAAIKKAIAIGYDDFKFLESDKDLDNLRRDKRFVAYYARVKSKLSSK